MADALISPTVGISMLAVSSGILAGAIRHVRKTFDEKFIPLMGVMGAFVFAMQMINFQIPGTGSSGHIGGGILLAAVIGPHAAFLVLSCVLAIQALFFADGGLLALGCNIFNLGVFPCFVAYPLIFRPLAGDMLRPGKVMLASVVSTLVALQLGAFCVALETFVSGTNQLPFGQFVAFMQSIHLAIGAVEGVLGALVITFIVTSRPNLFSERAPATKSEIRMTALVIGVSALVIGGGISLLASGDPDGLEWAIERVAGTDELAAEGRAYEISEDLQTKTSFLPDYALPDNDSTLGASFAGIAGTFIVFAVALSLGFFLVGKKNAANASA